MSTIKHPRRRRFMPARLIFGFALIAAGVIFSLEQMGIIENPEAFLRFWPLVLVAAGLVKAVWPGGAASGRLGGLILALVGGWIFLYEFKYIKTEIWELWPLVLVFIGFRIVTRGSSRRRDAGDSSSVTATALFGGTKRANNSQDFRGGDLLAMMGGCELDLRHARIVDSPAELDVFAAFGGIDIQVPEDWTVTIHGVPVLGAFQDETHGGPEDPDALKQELIVKGMVLFGGISIKN
jgi:predicted membrane protein